MNQWELWAWIPEARPSHLWVMGDSDTWIVFLITSLLSSLVCVAVTAEIPASQRYNAGISIRAVTAFVALGYSALTFIQNAKRFEVLSNMDLRPPSFAISTSCSSSSRIKVDSPGLFTNGLWIHPFPILQSFVTGKWCSNSYESCDRWSCANWENESPNSASSIIPATVWNMSKIPAFTLCLHNSSLALNAATLSDNLKAVVTFPWIQPLNLCAPTLCRHICWSGGPQ